MKAFAYNALPGRVVFGAPPASGVRSIGSVPNVRSFVHAAQRPGRGYRPQVG
jgi:hypothetical protein